MYITIQGMARLTESSHPLNDQIYGWQLPQLINIHTMSHDYEQILMSHESHVMSHESHVTVQYIFYMRVRCLLFTAS